LCIVIAISLVIVAVIDNFSIFACEREGDSPVSVHT